MKAHFPTQLMDFANNLLHTADSQIEEWVERFRNDPVSTLDDGNTHIRAAMRVRWARVFRQWARDLDNRPTAAVHEFALLCKFYREALVNRLDGSLCRSIELQVFAEESQAALALTY